MDANGSDEEKDDSADPETRVLHGAGHGEYSRADIAFDEMGQRFQVPACVCVCGVTTNGLIIESID